MHKGECDRWGHRDECLSGSNYAEPYAKAIIIYCKFDETYESPSNKLRSAVLSECKDVYMGKNPIN